MLLLAGGLLAGLAQQTNRFGLSGGITFSKIAIKSDGVTFSTSSLTGFSVGGLLDVPLTEHISFIPGLNYTMKGGKESEYDDFSGTTFTYKSTLNYLEVPLNFTYNTRGNTGNFFIGTGLSVCIGLSGKEKTIYNGVTESSNIKFGSGSNADLKLFDFGANFLAGYEFKNGINISVNYNAGLSNIAASAENGMARNNYFGVRLGYYFINDRK